MDKFEFMSNVTDAFEGTKTDEEIDFRAQEMINIIEQAKTLRKGYAKSGLLD